MSDFVREIPLTGPIPTTITWIVIVLAAVGSLLTTLLIRRLSHHRHGVHSAGTRRRKAIVRAVMVAVALLATAAAGVVYIGNVGWEEIPGVLIIYTIITVTALTLMITTIIFARGYRRRAIVWSLAPTVVLLIAGFFVSNQGFAIYPYVGSLAPQKTYNSASLEEIKQVPISESIPLEEWMAAHPDSTATSDAVAEPTTVATATPTADPTLTPPAGSGQSTEELLPADPRFTEGGFGTLVTAPIPATTSDFHARDALVYLPPAWFSNPRPQLPVVVVMAGIPGNPEQWIQQIFTTRTLDAYQRDHQGLAPIVIMADATGNSWDNPLCTDSPAGNVHSYLTVDVPRFAAETLDASRDHRQWTVGGLSYGGTCASQIATTAPEVYGNLMDYSGEAVPNNGKDQQETINTYFGGSREAFDAQNPEYLFSTQRYPGMRGIFVAGDGDAPSIEDLTKLTALAKEAGCDCSFKEVPGGHDFRAWRNAWTATFPTLMDFSGLPTPPPTPVKP